MRLRRRRRKRETKRKSKENRLINKERNRGIKWSDPPVWEVAKGGARESKKHRIGGIMRSESLLTKIFFFKFSAGRYSTKKIQGESKMGGGGKTANKGRRKKSARTPLSKG